MEHHKAKSEFVYYDTNCTTKLISTLRLFDGHTGQLKGYLMPS